MLLLVFKHYTNILTLKGCEFLIHFGNVITAMITPFSNNNILHLDTVQILVNHLIGSGSDAIVVSGTTGESPTLSFDEKIKLYDVVKQHAGSKAKVIAGTGTNNTSETIRLTQAAEAVGVDGVMLVTPYYNKPPQGALYQHFATVAGKTELPVMLYNVPGRTSCNISAETMVALSRIDNIIAIKEASGDLDQVSDLTRQSGDDVSIYSGDDSLTLPMLSVGGVGVVSVAAHIVGKEIKKMVDLYNQGLIIEASNLHQHLFPLFKGLFCTTNPIPVKTAMRLLGFDVGHLRLPLTAPTYKEEQDIKQLLYHYKLL